MPNLRLIPNGSPELEPKRFEPINVPGVRNLDPTCLGHIGNIYNLLAEDGPERLSNNDLKIQIVAGVQSRPNLFAPRGTLEWWPIPMKPELPATIGFAATLELQPFENLTDPLLEVETRADGWGVEFVYFSELGRRVHMANVFRLELADNAGPGYADLREINGLSQADRLVYLRHIEQLLYAIFNPLPVK
ncbi:TPA: hypothetical protein DIS56_03890 [Candidatus Saccharibacteria bacterium]|nr:MAG: hypothetical protein UX30_C0003G0077 [Candidatus Saccharibacteria bacterium GW2011_GWA2_46_10]OGL35212.1 MAG: hypothetical protein A3F05_00890 [Candidatus Saccharibacteria bacterium RIFCSPHIGHO2_12_FULL_47_17]HCM52239.1 hypothetical protein [Candidatus Saccharibacteria bacterium]